MSPWLRVHTRSTKTARRSKVVPGQSWSLRLSIQRLERGPRDVRWLIGERAVKRFKRISERGWFSTKAEVSTREGGAQVGQHSAVVCLAEQRFQTQTCDFHILTIRMGGWLGWSLSSPRALRVRPQRLPKSRKSRVTL